MNDINHYYVMESRTGGTDDDHYYYEDNVNNNSKPKPANIIIGKDNDIINTPTGKGTGGGGGGGGDQFGLGILETTPPAHLLDVGNQGYSWELDPSGGEGEPHDSGHFTAFSADEHNKSPSGSGGGCSRGPSPKVNNNANENAASSSSTAARLVLQVCREGGDYKEQGNNGNQYAYCTCEKPTTKIEPDSSEDISSSASSSARSLSIGQLQSSLDTFNALHQEKLQLVDQAREKADQSRQQNLLLKKVAILEAWAKDLGVQNMFLIHTVEDLRKQGEGKLRMLQNKLQESTALVKKHREVVDSYEQKIQTLSNEKDESVTNQKKLRQELAKFKSHHERVVERVKQLEKDNDNLVALVTRIRDMGVWDVSGLEFHPRTFAQMFELYPNLPGSEVQTIFTKEKARRVQETEQTIEKLETELRQQQDWKARAAEAIESKDRTISELEGEKKYVMEKLLQCQDECQYYKKNVIDTQEKLLRAANGPQGNITKPEPIHELLEELRFVKEQLSISVKESQSAKEETNIIRKEFSERLRVMQETQQSLQSELSQSLVTLHKPPDAERMLEEINAYRTTCQMSEQTIREKDQIITELHGTIQRLNNKHQHSAIEPRKLPRASTPIDCLDLASRSDCNQQRSVIVQADPSGSPQSRIGRKVKTVEINRSYNNSNSSKNAASASLNSQQKKSSSTKGRCQVHGTKSDVSLKVLIQRHAQLMNNRKASFSLCSCIPRDSDIATSENATVSSLKSKSDDAARNNCPTIPTPSSGKTFTADKGLNFVSKEDGDKCMMSMLAGKAVEASKEILQGGGMKNMGSISVIAGYRRHHRLKTDISKPVIEPRRVPKINDTTTSKKPPQPKNLNDALTKLPNQSPNKSVKKWISGTSEVPAAKASSSSITTFFRRSPRQRPSNLPRRTTKLFKPPVANSPESEILTEKSKQIRKDIADIKDEWSRIFSNVEPPSACSSSGSRGPSTNRRGEPHSSNQELEETEDLKKEEAKMEEDYRKLLRDKDVEITMQKLMVETMRSLQSLNQTASEIARKTNMIDSQMQLLSQLTEIKRSSEHIFLERGGISTSGLGENETVDKLAFDLKELREENFRCRNAIALLEDAFKKLDEFGPSTKDQIRRMQWELNLFDGICDRLQTKLNISEDEKSALVAENRKLKAENQTLTGKLSNTNLDLETKTSQFQQEIPSLNYNLNFKQSMQQIQEAFEQSESLLQTAKEELKEKDELVEKYQKYCEKIQHLIHERSCTENTLSNTGNDINMNYCEQEQWKFEKEHLQKTMNQMTDMVKVLVAENCELKASLECYSDQVHNLEHINEAVMPKKFSSPVASRMLLSRGSGDRNPLN